MADNPMTEAARKLRRGQTEEEKRLWFKLRENQAGGFKFRRQEPIGKYIVDFVNLEHKVVIENDGGIQQSPETRKNDRQRTRWIKSEGFKVIRFWNSSIMKDLDGVANKVTEKLGQRIHPHLTHRGRGMTNLFEINSVSAS
jgi:very-short-patch-repair endonuclease